MNVSSERLLPPGQGIDLTRREHRRLALIPLLITSLLLAVSAHAQSPSLKSKAAQIDAIRYIGEDIQVALKASTYDGFDPLEKRTIGFLAANAYLIIKTQECAAQNASSSAKEGFISTIRGIGHKSFQPIFELPDSRKVELVDNAMDIASRQQDPQNLVNDLCRKQLLPLSAVKPLAERQEFARQMLLIGLRSPASDPAAATAAPAESQPAVGAPP